MKWGILDDFLVIYKLYVILNITEHESFLVPRNDLLKHKSQLYKYKKQLHWQGLLFSKTVTVTVHQIYVYV